jgi:hypothetical protein
MLHHLARDPRRTELRTRRPPSRRGRPLQDRVEARVIEPAAPVVRRGRACGRGTARGVTANSSAACHREETRRGPERAIACKGGGRRPNMALSVTQRSAKTGRQPGCCRKDRAFAVTTVTIATREQRPRRRGSGRGAPKAHRGRPDARDRQHAHGTQRLPVTRHERAPVWRSPAAPPIMAVVMAVVNAAMTPEGPQGGDPRDPGAGSRDPRLAQAIADLSIKFADHRRGERGPDRPQRAARRQGRQGRAQVYRSEARRSPWPMSPSSTNSH